MSSDKYQTAQGNGGDAAQTCPPRPDPTGEGSFDEARRKLYEISFMILDVYNAVGTYERPPCKCDEYRQRLRVAQQKL
ncbi:hypothetical protein ACHAQH_009698 [Verticillium albo-atrum]